MNWEATVIVLMLLLCATVQGFILRREGRCHCPRATLAYIPAQYIKNVNFKPRGFNCFKEQVILVLKTGGEICVKPQAKWLKEIKMKVLRAYCRIKEENSHWEILQKMLPLQINNIQIFLYPERNLLTKSGLICKSA